MDFEPIKLCLKLNNEKMRQKNDYCNVTIKWLNEECIYCINRFIRINNMITTFNIIKTFNT